MWTEMLAHNILISKSGFTRGTIFFDLKSNIMAYADINNHMEIECSVVIVLLNAVIQACSWLLFLAVLHFTMS